MTFTLNKDRNSLIGLSVTSTLAVFFVTSLAIAETDTNRSKLPQNQNVEMPLVSNQPEENRAQENKISKAKINITDKPVDNSKGDTSEKSESHNSKGKKNRKQLSEGSLEKVMATVPNRPERAVLGYVERAMILPYKVIFDAKLDTGADFSSLNATDVEEYEQDGKKWVSFTVTNRYGDSARVKSPIIRVATIKGHHKNQKRLVIELGLCLNSNYMVEEVNLVNRSKFEYQMLIGRSFLAGKAFIDPASAYLSDPNCKEPKYNRF
jgi:hypothetical protein